MLHNVATILCDRDFEPDEETSEEDAINNDINNDDLPVRHELHI